MIQSVRTLSGFKRQLVLGLAWLAAGLYALAPAVPQQLMPMTAMAAGMHHDMAGDLAPMSGDAHHVMADMPDDCGMDAADMPGHPAGAKPSHAANHECPICKVAATAVVLAAPPALPHLVPDGHAELVASLWLPPSARVFSAQPRGPPSQS